MPRPPEVMPRDDATGDTDFVPTVTAPSMQDCEEIAIRVLFSTLHVSRFRTPAVMDRVKVGLKVPLDRAGG